jgi:hypothetical protein
MISSGSVDVPVYQHFEVLPNSEEIRSISPVSSFPAAADHGL